MTRIGDIFDSLATSDRDRVDGWRLAARCVGYPDSRLIGEAVQPSGCLVTENFFNECRLDDDCVNKVFGLLTPDGPFMDSFSQGIFQISHCPTPAVEPMPGAVLCRLIPASVVLRLANGANLIDKPPPIFGQSATDPQTVWNKFIAAWATFPVAYQDAFLGKLQLGVKHPCWAFVPPTGFDPAAEMCDASRLYDRLSLHWPAVEEIRHHGALSYCEPLALLLNYRWSDVLNVLVPTVADAGWWPRFAPAPAHAERGRTRDRRSTAENPTDSGLDEVIHDPRDARCIQGVRPGIAGSVS